MPCLINLTSCTRALPLSPSFFFSNTELSSPLFTGPSQTHNSPPHEHHMPPPRANLRWISLSGPSLSQVPQFKLSPSGPCSFIVGFSLNRTTMVETSSSAQVGLALSCSAFLSKLNHHGLSFKLHPLFETLFLFYFLSIYLLNFLFFL